MTANNITDGKVRALPIKPLKTHAGEALPQEFYYQF